MGDHVGRVAAVFALVALAGAELGHLATDSRLGISLAAFAAALVVLPLHRQVQRLVGRVVDRDATVVAEALHDFVQRVRDGDAQPEDVESVLRRVLADPGLRILLKRPGTTSYVGLTGTPVVAPAGHAVLPLVAQESDVGALVLGQDTARRQRRARQAAVAVRLPIEVSRLRIALREALEDTHASRTRLVEAATEERRRLERDLHDGAQQGIVAVGMRLRSVQDRLVRDDPSFDDLEAAVLALEAVVGELRRLAHGIRPGRLDDGLDVAIRQLAGASPIPVSVEVSPVDVSETVATTAYFVVAESLTNTLKHSGALSAAVSVVQLNHVLAIEVRDDGRGGAEAGRGLDALRDRVAALGGRLAVDSPMGVGTIVRAEL